MGKSGSPGFPNVEGGGLVAVQGSGTRADPYRGFWFQAATQWNATSISSNICSMSGSLTWMRVKRIVIGFDATAGGITVMPAIKSAGITLSGVSVAGVYGIGEKKITGYAQDALSWDLGPGLTLQRGANAAEPFAWNGTLVLWTSGYAATDWAQVMIELEWATQE